MSTVHLPPSPMPDREIVAFEAVALLRQRSYRVRLLEDGFPEWKMAGIEG